MSLNRLLKKSPKFGISLFYFMLSFITVFPSMNIWLILKEKSHLNAGDITLALHYMAFPWIMKPIFAFFTDRYPIFGYRRKSYIGIFSFLTGVSWLIMPSFLDNLKLFYMMRVLENLFLCCADVAVDSLVVERIKRNRDPEVDPYIQTVNSACKYFGKCIGSIASSIMLLENTSNIYTFYFTGMAPIIVSVLSYWIDEDKYVRDIVSERVQEKPISYDKKIIDKLRNSKTFFYVKLIWKGFYETSLFRFCIVITWYTFVPEPDSAYFYYYQDSLKIPTFQLQMMSLSSDLGLFIGTNIFLWKFTKVDAKTLMKPASLVICGLHMYHAVFIFLVNPTNEIKILHIYMMEFIDAIIDAFIYMPMYILGAKMCTTGIEGTSYALVHSIQGMGQFANDLLAAQIMMILGITKGSTQNIWYMSFFTAYLYLTTLLFLNILPVSKDQNDDESFVLNNTNTKNQTFNNKYELEIHQKEYHKEAYHDTIDSDKKLNQYSEFENNFEMKNMHSRKDRKHML